MLVLVDKKQLQPFSLVLVGLVNELDSRKPLSLLHDDTLESECITETHNNPGHFPAQASSSSSSSSSSSNVIMESTAVVLVASFCLGRIFNLDSAVTTRGSRRASRTLGTELLLLYYYLLGGCPEKCSCWLVPTNCECSSSSTSSWRF
jgi:hypothetical protein